MSDSDAGYSSDGKSSEAMHALLDDDILYHVLGQFLVTERGENLADCLRSIANELRALRELLAAKAR